MKTAHWLLIVIGLILIAGWFYWFQHRPSEIRKYCNKWADDSSGLTVNRAKWGNAINTEPYNNYYMQCLREQGLK